MGKEKTMQNQEIFKRPVWKAIFSMGIPSLISVLVMIIYNMADMYFIGFLNDYTQVAAVSLIMPVFSIMTAVSMLLGNGGCTLIAQALGAGEKKRARSYMSLCIWTAILLGVIIAGLIIVFSNPLLKFLGTNEEMWQYARNYMLILAVGSPAMLLNYTIACLVRGEGVIKPGLIANFVSTGMNILWDPVLILGVKMGVSGAALATVLSNVIGIVYLIWYKMHHEMILTFNPKPARESVRHLGRVFALGFPNAISNILNGFASTFSNQLLVLYGTSAVAAMAAAGKATMIVGLLQMGLCMGVQPLMAYYYGAGDMRRIKEVVMKLFILTLGIGVVFGAVGMLGSKALVGLFIRDLEVVELGQKIVCIQLLSAPFAGIYYIGQNFMQATGSALMATITSVLRQGVLLIPLLYIMNAIMKMMGIPTAHVIADFISIVVTSVLTVIIYKKVKNQLKQKREA
ncbi:MAG TPA: MATE family efflux transporter [Roseburia sp.]|jgi:multidrug efflux pump|nr:MATE family efflux transporter [Roseburia sp.]